MKEFEYRQIMDDIQESCASSYVRRKALEQLPDSQLNLSQIQTTEDHPMPRWFVDAHVLQQKTLLASFNPDVLIDETQWLGVQDSLLKVLTTINSDLTLQDLLDLRGHLAIGHINTLDANDLEWRANTTERKAGIKVGVLQTVDVVEENSWILAHMLNAAGTGADCIPKDFCESKGEDLECLRARWHHALEALIYIDLVRTHALSCTISTHSKTHNNFFS